VTFVRRVVILGGRGHRVRMQIEPGDILRDTRPEPVAGIPGRYQGLIPDAWRVVYAFGGATMATALRAAAAEVARDDLHMVSTDATFCQAVPCGPVAVQVEVLRNGRTAAQALVRLWALDPDDPDPSGPVGNDLVLTAVFGDRSDAPFGFVGAVAPEVPGPTECPSRPEADPDSLFARIPYHFQTEFRPTGRAIAWGREFPPGEPRSSSWFRFLHTPWLPDGRWEPATLALPGDILGPAVHAGAGSAAGEFFVISLQIGLQFVGDVRTEWVLQHTRAHVAGDGYATGTAELWDQDRRLVAIATQCARIRPLKLG
jgi:acyl-CoA thioesterase